MVNPIMMDIGLAIRALEKGKKLTRQAWKGKKTLYTGSRSSTEQTIFCTQASSEDRPWIPQFIDLFAQDWMIVGV